MLVLCIAFGVSVCSKNDHSKNSAGQGRTIRVLVKEAREEGVKQRGREKLSYFTMKREI